MKNLLSKLFTTVLIATLLVPLVGMAFWSSDETSEKRELAAFPTFMENGQFNTKILSELGNWFDDHFAFRSWLITAYADLENGLFRESSIRNVLRGKDDWLFYQETLDNFTGLNRLSDRQIHNIVHNLQLIQYSITSQGSHFLVTIVPNKNTVYPEQMKDRYLETEDKDIDRLMNALAQGGIPCVDLKTPLLNDERTLYFHKDSHWTNQGALVAYNTLMDAMGIEHNDLSAFTPTPTPTHESDLDTMLNPESATPEVDYDYSKAFSFQVDNEIVDFMDNWIETSNAKGSGTLLMFRDSFGEALAPFFANHFAKSYFSRLTPYNLIQIEALKPEWVIIERAERRMSAFQEQAAIMKMPMVQNMTYTLADGVEKKEQALKETAQIGEEAKESSNEASASSILNLRNAEGWMYISGTIPNLANDSEIYIETTWPNGQTYTYPVFYLEDGYGVYLMKDYLPKETIVKTLVKTGEEVLCLDVQTVLE